MPRTGIDAHAVSPVDDRGELLPTPAAPEKPPDFLFYPRHARFFTHPAGDDDDRAGHLGGRYLGHDPGALVGGEGQDKEVHGLRKVSHRESSSSLDLHAPGLTTYTLFGIPLVMLLRIRCPVHPLRDADDSDRS
jgi:hypothetical protein